MKDQKVTRVVSTKITEGEYDQLHKLAIHYKSQGRIAKASTSEILRCIIRVYIKHYAKITQKSD